MLSFMKEDSQETNAAGSAVNEQKDQDTTVQGSSASQDFLVPSTSGKKAKYSTIVLSVVFVIGLLALFMMIKKSAPSEAAAALSQQDLKIESAIAKLAGSKNQINSKMEDVVRKIDILSQVKQVDVSNLKRNPFKMHS